jgi:hypothetical protein
MVQAGSRRWGFSARFASTVDDSFVPGIGHRLDGWANRDLNVAITSVLGVDEAAVKKVLASWGPGKFDALLNLDGKAFRPDGKAAATLISPAFGLAGVNLHTWGGGWGTLSYWNAFVANLELNGRGRFLEYKAGQRRAVSGAAKSRLGHKQNGPDMVTAHLGPLHFYRLAIPVPKPTPWIV